MSVLQGVSKLCIHCISQIDANLTVPIPRLSLVISSQGASVCLTLWREKAEMASQLGKSQHYVFENTNVLDKVLCHINIITELGQKVRVYDVLRDPKGEAFKKSASYALKSSSTSVIKGGVLEDAGVDITVSNCILAK